MVRAGIALPAEVQGRVTALAIEGGNRREPQRMAIGLPPERAFPGSEFYFLFLGAFAFSVLTFRFAVFPDETHPQPQFIFLVIMSPPFVLSVSCRLRSSASADAPLGEVRREAVHLKALLSHPHDPLLEFLLPVVKPLP